MASFWSCTIYFTIIVLLGGSKVNADRDLHKRELPIIFEPGPVILGTTLLPQKNARPCTQSHVAECFDQLVTFSELDNLRFMTTKDDFEHFCSVTELGHNCTRSLYDQNICLSEQEYDLFPHYDLLANSLYNLLCNHNDINSFKTDLMKDSACFMKHKSEIDQCFHENQLPQIPMLTVLENGTESLAEKSHRICCSLERYIECSKQKINTACGPNEEDTIASYIQYAAGPDVAGFCLEEGFQNYPIRMDEACKSGGVRQIGHIFWIIMLFIPWAIEHQTIFGFLV